MAVLKKKIVGRKEYYYLEHSFREDRKIRKKEVYLGQELPEDIEQLKKNLINSIYKEKWKDDLQRIKQGFSKEIRTMPVSVREKENQWFMINFTYDTQRIEGSKLSLRDTANLLEKGITPSQKPVRDIREAEAHKEVFYKMLACKKDLSLNEIMQWHKKLFHASKPDIAGKIRKHGVAISGSRFLPPSPVELNPLLEDFFAWHKKNRKSMNPVELAGLAHLKFVTIHPFSDGNGRISRLMMNFVLNRGKYPMLDIHYEQRAGYYRALERAQIKNNEQIFVQWIVRKYIKTFKKYLK